MMQAEPARTAALEAELEQAQTELVEAEREAELRSGECERLRGQVRRLGAEVSRLSKANEQLKSGAALDASIWQSGQRQAEADRGLVEQAHRAQVERLEQRLQACVEQQQAGHEAQSQLTAELRQARVALKKEGQQLEECRALLVNERKQSGELGDTHQAAVSQLLESWEARVDQQEAEFEAERSELQARLARAEQLMGKQRDECQSAGEVARQEVAARQRAELSCESLGERMDRLERELSSSQELQEQVALQRDRLANQLSATTTAADEQKRRTKEAARRCNEELSRLRHDLEGEVLSLRDKLAAASAASSEERRRHEEAAWQHDHESLRAQQKLQELTRLVAQVADIKESEQGLQQQLDSARLEQRLAREQHKDQVSRLRGQVADLTNANHVLRLGAQNLEPRRVDRLEADKEVLQLRRLVSDLEFARDEDSLESTEAKQRLESRIMVLETELAEHNRDFVQYKEDAEEARQQLADEAHFSRNEAAALGKQLATSGAQTDEVLVLRTKLALSEKAEAELREEAAALRQELHRELVQMQHEVAELQEVEQQTHQKAESDKQRLEKDVMTIVYDHLEQLQLQDTEQQEAAALVREQFEKAITSVKSNLAKQELHEALEEKLHETASLQRQKLEEEISSLRERVAQTKDQVRSDNQAEAIKDKLEAEVALLKERVSGLTDAGQQLEEEAELAKRHLEEQRVIVRKLRAQLEEQQADHAIEMEEQQANMYEAEASLMKQIAQVEEINAGLRHKLAESREDNNAVRWSHTPKLASHPTSDFGAKTSGDIFKAAEQTKRDLQQLLHNKKPTSR